VVESGAPKLILSSGSPKEFELTRSEIIIGRDPAVDLPISSPAVSRRHARLTRDGGHYALEDLGSSNGTFVNEEKLTGRRPLKSGDQIRLGQAITMVFEVPPPQRLCVRLQPNPTASCRPSSERSCPHRSRRGTRN